MNGVVRKRKEEVGQAGRVSGGNVADEGELQMQGGAVGLTSCKQVYWTW